MTKSYEVDRPVSNLGYFILGIKYIVLFIVLFFASWIILIFSHSRRRTFSSDQYFNTLYENASIVSLTIAITVVIWFIYRARKKYKYGEVFKISFDDVRQKIEIKTVNLINDREKKNEYSYHNLRCNIIEQKDELFGEQRILIIENDCQKVHEINIERTAWYRHEKIEELIEKLKTIHSSV